MNNTEEKNTATENTDKKKHTILIKLLESSFINSDEEKLMVVW